jgi:hypothetical protein
VQKLEGYSQIQATGVRVATCTITVYQTGTLTLASIFSDNLNTPLSNPFTSDVNGLWFFYAPNGRYDVQMSGGSPTISPSYTLSDFLFNDPFGVPGVPTTTLRQGSAAGNYTTTSTTFVNVDATNLLYTVVIPSSFKLLISVSGNSSQLTTLSGIQIAIVDTGTVLQKLQMMVDGAFSLNTVISGDGNSHTVSLQFLTLNAANAAVIFNSGTTLVPTMMFILLQSN